MRDAPAHKVQLEVCIEDLAGLTAAREGGADRVELCSALQIGGLTPSHGFMKEAARMRIAAAALIRPRPGNFVFGDREQAIMLDDIAFARDLGLEGVVIGASREDGSLDMAALKEMCTAAGPLRICLHRVFDLVPDPFVAIDQAADLGISRILTSGQHPAIEKGIPLLHRLVQHAGDRLDIMPGGGVNPTNISAILGCGVRQIHSSCSWDYETPAASLTAFGFSGARVRRPVPADAVRAFRSLLGRITAQEGKGKAPQHISAESVQAETGGMA